MLDSDNKQQGDGASNDAAQYKYLSFILGTEEYAIEILRVKEIIEFGEITPVPMMPSFMKGAHNLRGHLVPIIDLAARLETEAKEQSARTCIVVIEIQSSEGVFSVGIVVDAVKRVVDIAQVNMESLPSFDGKLRTEFVKGMGKIDNKFIIVLNIDRILSFDDLNSMTSLDGQSWTQATTPTPMKTEQTEAPDALVEHS